MSQTLARRNSILSRPSTSSEPKTELLLQFLWSASAANTSSYFENTESIVSSSLDTDRSQRKILTASSSCMSLNSGSRSLTSPRKSSLLPNIIQKNDSPIPPLQDFNSKLHNPLSVSYAELNPVIAHVPIKKSKSKSSLPVVNNKRQSVSINLRSAGKRLNFSKSPIADERRRSLYIHPVTDDKRNSIATSPTVLEKRKSLSISPIIDDRRRSASIQPVTDNKRETVSTLNNQVSTNVNKAVTAVTTISYLTAKSNRRTVQHHLVRLGTPQLRKLKVSEKYMNEAKRLYYDVPCRSFVPRLEMV